MRVIHMFFIGMLLVPVGAAGQVTLGAYCDGIP